MRLLLRAKFLAQVMPMMGWFEWWRVLRAERAHQRRVKHRQREAALIASWGHR